AEPDFTAGGGKTSVTSSSPGCSTFFPGAVQNCSTLISRWPFGPAVTHVTPCAMRAGIVSAAGDELHRLPPTLARLGICQPPTIFAASASAGYALAISAFS